MAKRTFKLRIWPASGGVDQSSIPGTVRVERLDDCDNIIFTVNGSRKKRWGLKNYYRSGFTPTISSDFRGMIDFWRNVSSVQTQKMVVFAGGKLWQDSHDGRFTDVSGTTTLYAGDQVTFDVYVGYLMACFESSVPQYWIMSGNFADLPGTAPNGSLVRVHRSHAWISGVKAYPHRVYYSKTDDPADWTDLSAGSIDFDQGDSDPVGVTALFPSFHNNLYVAKRRSLYVIKEAYSDDLASTVFQTEPVVKGIGCIAHNSVASTPSDIIWASEKGVHSLTTTDQYGDVQNTYLSLPIQEYYLNAVSLNKSKNMWGTWSAEMNSYLLAFTRVGKSSNYDVMGYNVVLGNWFFWYDIDCAALCQMVDTSGKTRTLVGRESDLNMGYFKEDLVDDFTDTTFDSYFTTPIIYPTGYPDITSNFKALWVFMKPQETGSFNLIYKIDGKTEITESVSMSGTGSDVIGTAVIGTGIIGGTGEIKKVKVPLKGEGCGIQFTFSFAPSTTSQDFDIYGYVIEGEYADDSSIPTVAT